MGKILHVDLTSGSICDLATETYREFLGGRGIASRLYWEKVTPDVGAFVPENRLIFMTGPVLATGAQGAARMCVAGKSPMTLPEGYCYGSLGGHFPAEIKKAGWDGIILDGRADKPVYLVVEDSAASLRDADWLWGKGARAVESLVAEKHGEKARFVTTGVAGENRVRSAVLYASLGGTVSAGFGAVMASKNLKAIVIRGTGHPQAADRQRMAELSRYTRELSDTCDFSVMPRIDETGHSHLLENVGRRHCYQCGLTCHKFVYRMGNDPELVGLSGCEAIEYYLPWTYNHEDEPVKTLCDAPALANDYSICTFELWPMIDWLYACHRRGVLSEKDTGLPLSRIGTREFLERLLHAIAYREGFGDTLAEGMMRVHGMVSPEAAALFPRSWAPIGLTDGVPPRAHVAHALLYPFETRMHPISLHETGYLRKPWYMNQDDPLSSDVTPEAFLEIARKFWGSEAAADMLGYEGKAVAARNIQNRTYLRDSLGLCDFIYPITYSFSRYGPVGDPDLEGKMFTAATGIDASELPMYAERIFNMQRLICVREGHRVPEDDYPPEFNFTEPLFQSMLGAKMMVPGAGAQPVDATGNALNRHEYTVMLKEYYALRGWDEKTGLPTAATLQKLSMDDVGLDLSHEPGLPESVIVNRPGSKGD
jgi:aldehyde:ferredoxin oxidoreductase